MPGSQPWYANYPLPQLSNPHISLYTFSSGPLEALVYAHPLAPSPAASFYASPAQGPTGRADNSVLQWTGASVIQSLAAILLTSVYPDLKEGALNDIRSAITGAPLHTQLARTLNLGSRLPPGPTAPGDHILATLFCAYVGGIQRDLGTERFGDLYTWYFRLLEPYAVTYQGYYNSYLSSLPPPMPHTSGAPGTVAVNPPSDSRLRRQNVAGYTSRLMEYAAKTKLSAPTFVFRDNGQQGAGIQWSATVSMNNQVIARAVASTKLEAKHLASMEALVALRAPLVSTPPGMGKERREKKQMKRRGGFNGAGRGGSYINGNTVPIGGGGGGGGGGPMGSGPMGGGPMGSNPMGGLPMVGGIPMNGMSIQMPLIGPPPPHLPPPPSQLMQQSPPQQQQQQSPLQHLHIPLQQQQQTQPKLEQEQQLPSMESSAGPPVKMEH